MSLAPNIDGRYVGCCIKGVAASGGSQKESVLTAGKYSDEEVGVWSSAWGGRGDMSVRSGCCCRKGWVHGLDLVDRVVA